MIQRDDLTCYFEELFRTPVPIDDGSNNGLQVEGRPDIRRVAFAVDACEAVFQRAAELEADALLVHHGISWGGGLKYLTGQTARRIRLLMDAGVSLYAYHLPLDWHPEVGNNAVIARILGLTHTENFCLYGGIEIGKWGRLDEPVDVADLAIQVQAFLATECRISGPNRPVSRIGVVSGGAASAVMECAALGLDCLLTGEFAHQYVHDALELGVSVIAAGHYRTEVCGVRTVMDRISAALAVDCVFIDIPTHY